MRSALARRGRRWPAVAGALVLLGVLVGSIGVGPSNAATDTARLPVQPGQAAPTCTPILGAANEWAVVGEPLVLADNPNADVIPYRLAPDPWRPCLAYRVAGDMRRLERTTDGGRTWRVVFLDERPASDGRPMRITGVYVPAPNTVYLSEDGNGMAMVRSTDAGATWSPANGGLAGRPVWKVWFAPSDPLVAYAATLTGGSGPYRNGSAVSLFVTRDGGGTWRAAAGGSFVKSDSFSGGVDPLTPGHFYLGISGIGYLAGGRILETRDYGQTFAPLSPFTGDLAELIVARRATGLRLYRLTNESPPGLRYTDDNGANWKKVFIEVNATWLGGLVDPVAADKVLYFGVPQFEARSKMLALYTRNGFSDDNQEYGEQPPIERRPSKNPTHWSVDRFGQFYIDVGIECQEEGCEPGGAPITAGTQYAYRTLRFRPPDPGQAFVIGAQPKPDESRGGVVGTAKRCDVAPLPPEYPRAGGDEDSGTLAFDGDRLYYTRRGETGPDPLSAVVRVVDPGTCNETGRLVVHFDEAVYGGARRRAVSNTGERVPTMPERPSIDSLGYDAVRDELWFSVTRVEAVAGAFSGAPKAPYPVWSFPRRGHGPDRQATLRFWTEPCGRGGVGLLAHDASRDTLWTCDGKTPGELRPDGTPRPVCLHPLFAGSEAEGDDVRDVIGWGVGRPGTLVAVLDDSTAVPPRRFEQFDARACKQLDTWSILLPDSLPTPRQGPEFVSSQLVCDALTLRAAADPPAVFWMRSGPTFAAYTAPNLSCPSSTAASYAGRSVVDPGERLDVCTVVTVPGPGAPIPGAAVRIRVADSAPLAAATDAAGKACVPYEVPRVAEIGSRIPVRVEVVEDLHLLASAGTASIAVGSVPPPPPGPPPAVAPPSPPTPPAPPPIPLPLTPSPAPAPQPGVQPAASPPGQAVSQQGLASEKEREVQLAHAQQESSGQDEPAEAPAVAEPDTGDDASYAFAAAAVGGTALAALALARAVAPATAPVSALVHAPAIAAESRARRRRHRGRA